MKKLISVLVYIILGLTLFFPLALLVFNICGYTFRLTSGIIYSIIIALLAVITVILSIIFKEPPKSKVIPIICAILPPLVLICSVFYLWIYPEITVAISMIILLGCCIYFAIRYNKQIVIKIVSLSLAGLMIFPIIFLSFFLFLANDFGEETVIKSLNSPSNTYCAKIIDSDQGALGGNTIVEVQRNRKINCFIFTLESKPEIVYIGDWGEFIKMQMKWKDDNCLIINANEYIID